MLRMVDLPFDMQPRMKMGLVLVSTLLLGYLGWWAYASYVEYQGKKAQVILSESLAEYQKALESKENMWSEVKLASDLGFDQTAGTALQPYFLVMEAQALAQQGSIDEAVAAMQKAYDSLSDGTPFKQSYALTIALMQLDASQEKDKGLARLQELASDSAYQFQDAALYYLGAYYWAHDDIVQAKEAWQQLLNGAQTTFVDSPWVERAAAKIGA